MVASDLRTDLLEAFAFATGTGCSIMTSPESLTTRRSVLQCRLKPALRRGAGCAQRTLSVLATLLAFSSPFSVQADVLELKSGQKLEGQYAGGSKDEVRFQMGSQTLKFPIAEVSKITMGTGGREDFHNAAKEALRQLKGLASVVEGGTTYSDYARRVTDAKIKVDQFLDEYKSSPLPLFNEQIADILGFYVTVSSAWNRKLSSRGSDWAENRLFNANLARNTYVRNCAPLQALVALRRSEPGYNEFRLPQDVAEGVTIIVEGLQPLWECARNSLIDAEKVLDR